MPEHEKQPVSRDSVQDENLRLKRAVEELSILNDLARAIGASLNSQEIMRTIIHRSIHAINAEQGVITMVDRKAGAPMKTLIRSKAGSGGGSEFHFNETLLGWIYLNKRPLMINDPRGDERFRGFLWDDSIRSLLSVPLVIKSALAGVLTVYNKQGIEGFTEEDQRLLAIIASQSAQVIENARLYEAEHAFHRMKEEVRLAAEIQLALLPKDIPVLLEYDLAGKTVPARMVGGDYFDFIPIDGKRIAICLGDVSGKGLAAALLMSNVQATIRGQTLVSASPGVCMRRSNTLLFESTSSESFVTLFYGILDTEHHTLRYSNAGHDTPLFLGKGEKLERLETGGVVLSVFQDYQYEEGATSFSPNDVLVVYSDGITEAHNPYMEMFGEGRLLSVINDKRDGPASGIIGGIIDAVRSFTGSSRQDDDITLLVVKRKMTTPVPA